MKRSITRILRSRYFWYVVAFTLFAAFVSHTPQIAPLFHFGSYSDWELTYYPAIYRTLFVIAVAIAAWQFGVYGGLIVCLVFIPVTLSLFIPELKAPYSWLDAGLLALGVIFSILIGRLGNMKKLLEKSYDDLKKQSERLKSEVEERKKAEEGLAQILGRLERALHGYIDVTAKMVEMRDPYTAGHQRKVAELAEAIAKELNLPEDQIKGISMAAAIHDIGKIHIPAEILNHTSKLIDPEHDIIKTHVQGGFDILKNVEFPWPIAEMILQHHERLDGSGYPKGLKGDKILLEAKIIALADTVEAMSTHRPYRPAFGMGDTLKEISKNKGVLYDPAIVEVCITLIQEKGFRFKY